MFSHHFRPLQPMHDDPSQTTVEQWARLEGKSESMTADLVQASNAACRQRASGQAMFCPRCFSCGVGGALLAIAVERWIF